MKINKTNPGFNLAIGSALAYTCYDVGVRAFLHEITVWGMLLIRGLLGVALAGFLAYKLRRPLWGRHQAALTGAGICAFLSSVCNAVSISTIPLYQALVILYLYPVFTLMLAAPINNEPVTRRNLGLVGLALSGCLALIWPDEAIGLKFSRGHLIGLGGAVLYSLGQVLIRRAGKANSGLEPIFYYSLFALGLAVPLSLFFGDGLGIGTTKGFSTALVLAVLGMTAQLSGFAALRWMPAFRVGLVGALELLAGTVISWLIFHDPMNSRALAGGAVIVAVIFRLRCSAPATIQAEKP